MQGEIQPMRGEIKVNIRKLGKFGETWKIQKTRNNKDLKFYEFFNVLFNLILRGFDLTYMLPQIPMRGEIGMRWDSVWATKGTCDFLIVSYERQQLDMLASKRSLFPLQYTYVPFVNSLKVSMCVPTIFPSIFSDGCLFHVFYQQKV